MSCRPVGLESDAEIESDVRRRNVPIEKVGSRNAVQSARIEQSVVCHRSL